jgi:hypothetical protein
MDAIKNTLHGAQNNAYSFSSLSSQFRSVLLDFTLPGPFEPEGNPATYVSVNLPGPCPVG